MEIARPARPKDQQEWQSGILYADQPELNQKYKGVYGCRYPYRKCYANFVLRRCCHWCSDKKTCKDRCLSDVRHCQSKWRDL